MVTLNFGLFEPVAGSNAPIYYIYTIRFGQLRHQATETSVRRDIGTKDRQFLDRQKIAIF